MRMGLFLKYQSRGDRHNQQVAQKHNRQHTENGHDRELFLRRVGFENNRFFRVFRSLGLLILFAFSFSHAVSVEVLLQLFNGELQGGPSAVCRGDGGAGVSRVLERVGLSLLNLARKQADIPSPQIRRQ